MVVLQKLSRPHFDKNSYFYTVFFRLGFEKKNEQQFLSGDLSTIKHMNFSSTGIIECSGSIPGWSTG